jgi:hypothetical protein
MVLGIPDPKSVTLAAGQKGTFQMAFGTIVVEDGDANEVAIRLELIPDKQVDTKEFLSNLVSAVTDGGGLFIRQLLPDGQVNIYMVKLGGGGWRGVTAVETKEMLESIGHEPWELPCTFPLD